MRLAPGPVFRRPARLLCLRSSRFPGPGPATRWVGRCPRSSRHGPAGAVAGRRDRSGRLEPLRPPAPVSAKQDLGPARAGDQPLHSVGAGRCRLPWLEALHQRLVAPVMATSRIFADDTPLPVPDPGRGRTKTGRLWGYTRNDRPFGGSAPPAVSATMRPIAPAPALPNLSDSSAASCRWTVTPVSRRWLRMASLLWRRAGRTRGAGCSRCTKPNRHWRRRQCRGSAGSARSRQMLVACRRTSGDVSAGSGQNLSVWFKIDRVGSISHACLESCSPVVMGSMRPFQWVGSRRVESRTKRLTVW